nr:hypothetical protein [Tanacetum cinerariifolium]
MKGSGKSLQQKKEELFDKYKRFRAIGNDSIHDYFVCFHKLINDMKITQLDILAHQMNTKFVNNLPHYRAKYVTNVKNNKDIFATTYVELYTYLKSYEPHALKALKKQEQSSSIVTDNKGKLVICYNCHGEGHVSRQCKEKKRVKDSQYFKDKMLLMEAKEKGADLMKQQLLWPTYHPQVEQMMQPQVMLMSEVQDVPTKVSSVSPGEISMITILDDLRNRLDGHLKVNQKQIMVNDSLRAKLERYENLVKEVTEFMRIFDELDKEYEQCVLEKKKLQIEKKNLLIQNECLIIDCIAKDICSIVLASDRDRPLSEELCLNCAKCEKARIVEDHHRNLNKQNHVDSRLNVKRTGFVSNSNTVCNACNESLVFANHDNCVVHNLKSVNFKTSTTKHNVKTTKKFWKAKVVTIRSQWKPTGQHFTLYDEYPLTRIVEPIVKPLELTPYCKLLAVGSPFFWQWEHPPLAVGTYTASGNSLLVVGMPCAFSSQQKVPAAHPSFCCQFESPKKNEQLLTLRNFKMV